MLSTYLQEYMERRAKGLADLGKKRFPLISLDN